MYMYPEFTNSTVSRSSSRSWYYFSRDVRVSRLQYTAGTSAGTFPRSTQPSIPPGSVNEYQLWLGRQRQVWLIPIVDERVAVLVKL